VQFSLSREFADCLYKEEGGGQNPKNLDNVKAATALVKLKTKEFIHLSGKCSLR